MFRFFFFPDPSVIVLTVLDVDDLHVHIDIENIRTNSMEHLQNWLQNWHCKSEGCSSESPSVL